MNAFTHAAELVLNSNDGTRMLRADLESRICALTGVWFGLCAQNAIDSLIAEGLIVTSGRRLCLSVHAERFAS